MAYNAAKVALSDSPLFSNEYLALKERRLRKAASEILAQNPSLQTLRDRLGLTEKNILDTYVAYDLDISKNNNEMYHCVALRYVLHMHNLLEGSWHIERQNTAAAFIEKSAPHAITDMGFGVPTLYIKNLLEKNSSFQLTLCDSDASAIQFAEALLEIWAPNRWQDKVHFKSFDMNTGLVIPDQDLYLFQSSIEHVVDCSEYLTKHVQEAKPDAHFLLSLPIGDITPEHYMEWKTTEEARQWLKACGLNVVDSKLIHVNPKVDLFADYHHFKYSDFYVLCEKEVL